MKSSDIVINSTEPPAILSVSPMKEDQHTLSGILNQCFVSDDGKALKLELVTTWTLEKATNLLRRDQIPIAICESDLQPGSWKELLAEADRMPHKPLVIVTSRLADERLWAEVLNFGGWDVLIKPFDRREVVRVVESAWRHWKDQHNGLESRLVAG